MTVRKKYVLIPVYHAGAGSKSEVIEVSSLGACGAIMGCCAAKVQDFLSLGKSYGGYFVDYVIK